MDEKQNQQMGGSADGAPDGGAQPSMQDIKPPAQTMTADNGMPNVFGDGSHDSNNVAPGNLRPVFGSGGGKGGSLVKKIIIIVVALVVLAGGAVGAWFLMSGDKKSESSTDQAADDKKTTLVFAVHWLEDYQINGVKKDGELVSKGLKQYLDEYTKLNPNVKFAVQQIEYGEYANKLKVLDETGAGPDIYQIYSPWGATYVRAGMLDEPSADIQKDIKENYVSAAGPTIDGKIWGYPTEINNFALLYNKDLFKAAGITSAPRTWQEVVAAANKLTKRDASGKITQYGISFLKDNDWQVVDPFLSLLFSNGGSYLSSDLKTAQFNSAAGVEALDAMVQLFRNNSTDINGNFFDFKDGKVGMVVSPPWPKATFAESYGADFSKSVGVAPMPYLKEADTLQYSWFAGVMKNSQHKSEAWKFLKWFASDVQESGTTRYGDLNAETIGAIPARNVDFNAHKTVLGDFYTSVYVNQMKQSTAEPNVLEASAIKTALMKEIQAAWTGTKTSKQALDSAKASVDSLLSKNYQ